MPNRDGTGRDGTGRASGRGLGNCDTSENNDDSNCITKPNGERVCTPKLKKE